MLYRKWLILVLKAPCLVFWGLGFWGSGYRGVGFRHLVSRAVSPLMGFISTYKYSYLIYNPSY